MTKKRFKLSMAALGLLAAFFMVLIAVLLAPTLASANKDGGTHHHGAMPDTGHIPGGAGGAPHGWADNWNESGHDHGNAFDAPFCVDGGVYSCSIFGDPDDAFDGAGGNPDSYENGYSGGGNPQGGNGSSNDNNGRYSPSFWNGGGGGNGGGAGQGGGQDDDKTGAHESGNPDSEKDGAKTDDSDPPLLTLTNPDDDQPNDFVDPDFGDDDRKTEDDPKDDPKGEEQPITEITVTEVPEPLTLSLFAVGLVGAASLRRRSRQS